MLLSIEQRNTIRTWPSYCITSCNVAQSQCLVGPFWHCNTAYILDCHPLKVYYFSDHRTDLPVNMSSLPLWLRACLWIYAQAAPINKKAERKAVSCSSGMKKGSFPSHHFQWVTAVQSKTKVSSVWTMWHYCGSVKLQPFNSNLKTFPSQTHSQEQSCNKLEVCDLSRQSICTQ